MLKISRKKNDSMVNYRPLTFVLELWFSALSVNPKRRSNLFYSHEWESSTFWLLGKQFGIDCG